MPEFSAKSRKRLLTVHPDLQTLFLEVIKHRDCSVISGLRSEDEQRALYASGRSEPGKIVTHRDGINRRSLHQTGLAVDVIPYPEGYDEDDLRDFGNFVKGIAVIMKRYGAIDKNITWGGDWEWKDKPHWEI